MTNSVAAFNLSNDIGKVRLLIPDRGPDWFAFGDDEISAFLAIEGGNLKLAAALGIETIASDIAMVDKVIETLDLKTDGAKTAEALLKRAKTLRDDADDDLAKSAIDIVEYGDLTVFNEREYRRKNGYCQ